MEEPTEQQSNNLSSPAPPPQTELQPTVQHTDPQQTVQQSVATQLTRNQAKKLRWPSWTGFKKKTLWDWLNLLATLLIPFVIVGAIIWFSWWQGQLAAMQHQNDLNIAQNNRLNDQKIANDQQQEATLTSYLNDMSDLLLNHDLANSRPGDQVSNVARERTLTVLRRLHDGRDRTVLQFLQDAHLIGIYITGRKYNVINLSRANLSGDDLSGANLSYVDLSLDDLSHANLSHADLSHANLYLTNLSGDNLEGADLSQSINLTQQQLDQVSTCPGRTLPQGLACHRSP